MNTLKAIPLVLTLSLFLISCKKEEIKESNPEPISVEFKEDSVTNKIGCYYPLYNPN